MAAVGSRSRIAQAAGSPDIAGKVSSLLNNTANVVGSILNQPAKNSPIDTIVILMMENRSFDHYLGWLPDDDAYMYAGTEAYGERFHVDGRTDLSYIDPATGREVRTYHLPSHPGEQLAWRGCGHPDPGHGPLQGRAQRDHGFLANSSGNDAFALGYFRKEDLPTYAPLASHFTIFDRYHCSLLSSTYPNRLYLQSAQCGDDMDPPLPIDELGFDWPAIWDRLLAAGVSCANYFVDLPTSIFFGPRMVPIVRPFADFFVDAALGQLPHVVLLDPGFISGFRTDDHPVGDMRVAQAFTANVVKAITKSPQWGRTALFITYDEWGGFFDHVAPALMADGRASSTDTKNFGQAGFRVPTFMVSPYALPNYVDHRPYDHTSILRFIEWRFLGAPAEGPGGSGWWLTERDRHAYNIGASLQSTKRSDIYVSPVPQVPLASTPCQGYWMQDVPEIDSHDRAGEFAAIEAPISGLDLFRTSGYLERIGLADRGPSLTPRELVGS
ncbi:MAG TPA: alkaline phosphatase family protein [Acidimicrobiales bacterium]|nr:alkaline phosphatase family protein [Acidimicrobiales bacterium]